MHVPTNPGAQAPLHGDGMLRRLLATERAILEAARLRDDTAERLCCPKCQENYLPGALACSHCGQIFVDRGKTARFFGTMKELSAAPKLPVGNAFTAVQRPIVFEVDGARLVLPLASTLVVGRRSNIPGDLPPDVNLNAFNAEALGVSRQHIKIVRKDDLTYFSDMGSKNGTYLNGRPLLGGGQRILRDNDELRLGHLTLRVRF